MPKFLYTGVGANGKQIKGEIDAPGKNEVITLLRKKKIKVISVKGKPMGFGFTFSTVSLNDLSRFTRQFAAMTSAGLPLVQCLDILSSQTENKTLAKAIGATSNDIQGGASLADALSKFPAVFNTLYCSMVSAGEASGNLDTILIRLADYQEKSAAIQRKIKGAMTYPLILGIIAIGVVIVMLAFVVPTFSAMFSSLGSKLPAPTQFVVDLSNFLRNYYYFLIAGAIGAAVAFTMYRGTEKGEYNLDALLLNIPILGGLQRKSAISRFSQTLSTLLSSGVTILDALAITSKTSGNKVLERGLVRTQEKISGGMTIAEPLKETGVFPPMVIHMISVGEKTGDLAGMLAKIAQFYSEEVDAAVEALTSILEPIMIVFMGVIIGGLLIAMYMPMFDLIGNIQ